MYAMVCSVLWLHVSTTEHDAGLYSDVHLPTSDARQYCRFSRQGVLYFAAMPFSSSLQLIMNLMKCSLLNLLLWIVVST